MAQQEETIMGTHRTQRLAAAGRNLSGVLGLLLVATVGPAQAQGTPTILAPGETRVLEVADGATCELVFPPQRTDGGTGASCTNQSPTPSYLCFHLHQHLRKGCFLISYLQIRRKPLNP